LADSGEEHTIGSAETGAERALCATERVDGTGGSGCLLAWGATAGCVWMLFNVVPAGVVGGLSRVGGTLCGLSRHRR